MLTDQCRRQTGKQIRVLECYGIHERPVGGFSSQSGPSPHSSWSRCGETGKVEGEGGVEAHIVFIILPLVRCLYYPGPAVPLPRWILHFFSFPLVVYYRILTIVPCAGPHCLSILYIIICLPVPALNLSLPYPSPLASTSLLYVCEPVL